ncbi:hypothetical protein [Actinoplanes palleronii]|uniref:MarR family transcriptional regulator n=1 Tax=Actinoplanes palleronii TaxID=113570 RepID=A0ABQ4BDT0_9ACTN|nr:hypothetical protein [Actinoplanes palleronii]GIE68824.1 hypothetical protein Apa02nite_049320 [Actinoplanes palleronii]
MSDRPRFELDILNTITDCLRRANEVARRVTGPERPRPAYSGAEPAVPLVRRVRRAR